MHQWEAIGRFPGVPTRIVHCAGEAAPISLTAGGPPLKRIALLGSTGSIGRSTLDVVEHLNGRVQIASLAARSNWQLLAQQAKKHLPELVALAEEQHVSKLEAALAGTGIRIVAGVDGLAAAASIPGADVALVAVVGAAGLPAALAALDSGKTLALANKEALVMAGELLMTRAVAKGLPILPVDSEHSAIHQCLRAGGHGEAERITLTASGGPFRAFSRHDLDRATPEMALRHPTWSMGAKVTIDSATLTNKALEVLEAHWLFAMPPERIGVVVHPQSIVHSMVEFRDGSTIAQLGVPDMRVPIQYALTYPERMPGLAARLDLPTLRSLTFEAPDTNRFPGLLLGWRAAEAGGTAGAVLNAANEVAVELFLARRIRFLDITRTVMKVMDAHRVSHPASVEDVFEADRWAREKAAAVAPVRD